MPDLKEKWQECNGKLDGIEDPSIPQILEAFQEMPRKLLSYQENGMPRITKEDLQDFTRPW